MIIRQKRFSYSKTEVESTVKLSDGTKFALVEQPWKKNPNGTIGGLPWHSCVPDGMYQLIPWTSPSKGAVYLIYNPKLGVHKLPGHHDEGEERDLCLWHVGNYSKDVEGCGAIGLKRATKWHGVVSSRKALALLNEKLGRDTTHILSIESIMGASDVV